MTSVSLRFPVVVRVPRPGAAPEYSIRPLLAEGTEVRDRKFERAMAGCVRIVRQKLDQQLIDRGKLDRLLWYKFDPPLTSRMFDLAFKSGQQAVQGSFMAVWFDVGGHRYVCLPGFDDHLFVARPDEKKRYRMALEVERVVQHLLRAERRKLGDDLPDPEEHLARPGDFVTTITTSVHVTRSKIAFQEDPFAWFLRTQAMEEVDGEVELHRVGINLNDLHEEERPWGPGREELVERLHGILYEAPPSATVLIGPSGAGKTTLVHAAVNRYLRANRQEPLGLLQQLWLLDPIRLVAGMSVVGQWERRCEAIFTHLETRLIKRYGIGRQDILYLDNPVGLVKVGKSGQDLMVVSDVLKPYLEEGAMPVLAECTAEAWNVIQEKNRGFADLFRVLRVPEPSPRVGIEMALRQRAELERRHGCRFDNDAVHRAIDLGRMYRQRRAMPARAVDFLTQLATRNSGQEIQLGEVDRAFRRANRLSALIFDQDARIDADELDAFVASRLIGQRDAKGVITEVIHTIKARLTDPETPSASLLFVGPTGVGKTEAAKVLADFLFDDPQCLIRFDMNEFVDAAAAGRLVGDSQRPDGQLTGRVRHRPFSLLLLDEIEKAHPAVHDLLLQLLGEGRLTDSLGRTVDFSNCVVVMTSNLGAAEAGPSIGFVGSTGSRAAAYRKAVEDFFRPELFNRIDRLVVFETLGRDDVLQIARLQLARVLGRHGFAQRSSFLDVSDAVLDRIALIGHEPEMGARALKRVIEKEITSMAAEQLIRIPAGQQVMIHLFARKGRLVTDVTPLEFVERTGPGEAVTAPSPKDGARFYRRLLEAADEARAEVAELEGELFGEDPVEAADNHDHALALELREELSSVRGELLEVLEAHEEPDLPHGSAILQKIRARVYKEGRCGWEQDPRAIAAQLSIRDYLEAAYQAAELVAGQGQERALDDRLRVALLRHRSRDLRPGKRVEYRIQVSPLLKDSGIAMKRSRWLVGQYIIAARTALGEAVGQRRGRSSRLLEGGDSCPFTSVPEQDDPRWPGFLQLSELHGLFRGETGTHLFYEPYGAPVPISVTVEAIECLDDPVRHPERREWVDAFERGEASLEDGHHRPGPVVRLYAPEGAGGAGTATDVRTGFMCRYHSLGESLPLWLYSALPESEKLILGGE